MAIFDDYKSILSEWLAFPSVSTDRAFRADVGRTAAWLAELFRSRGFTVETWEHGTLNPVVFASYIKDEAAPTILVYGHYDVQPAAKSDGWHSDPFTLAERAGRLYGRGVVDNKGQVLIHMVNVFELIRAGELAYNVKFLIEGDEETGSAGLEKLLAQKRSALSCDHILISDGEIPYRPTIEASLRGGFNLRVQYRTATTNQHSGIYGGAIPNAAQELSRLLGSLYDAGHRVTVPGFYNEVDPITPPDSADTAAMSPDLAYLTKTTGVKADALAGGQNFATATGLQPTLQVSGISSGYTGEGFANIIPAEAEARINVRTVASQHSKTVYAALADYIRKATPGYVDCELTMEMPVEAIKLPIDTPFAIATRALLKRAFREDPLTSHSGGSIPVVSHFKEILGQDSLLVSLGNDDCNMHGANENFEIDLLKKGLAFSRLLFSQPPQK